MPTTTPPAEDYNAIAWTDAAGGTQFDIEKRRWDPPKKDKRILFTGEFWEALRIAKEAKAAHQANECPF